MRYKFLDVGCKIGGSFQVAKSYGFEKNETTLKTFLRYHFEQGLSKRLLQPEELFAPESLEAFVI